MRANCDEDLFGKDEGYVNVMDGMHWEFAWAHLLWSNGQREALAADAIHLNVRT
jgi:hypothetical protein